MTGFDDIFFIGESSIPSLTLTVILMIAIPVVFFIFWRVKHKLQTNISWLIAGALGFIATVRVLELGVHLLCIVMDSPVSRFINSNTVAYVIYGTVMAGVFEECGRYIIMRYIMKKNRTRENSVMYGIGHGGAEILAVVLPSVITMLAVAVLFSSGDTESAMTALNITEETADAALPYVQTAAAFDYGMTALNIAERLFAMFIHIGLSVIVYHGVISKEKIWLPAVVLLHMAADTFPALYQRGVLPLWSVEVWGAFWAVVIMLIAAALYRKAQTSQPEDSEP